MERKKMQMDIINPHCAGIDIGSRSHFVAVGQALEDVKEFGVYADDLTEICLHLKNMALLQWLWKAPATTGKTCMWNLKNMD